MRGLNIGILSLALTASSLPAPAQGWGVRADDEHTLMTGRNFISVVDSPFASVPDRADARLD